MVPVKLVTGYVPIPNHPRTPEEYGKLGENFRDLRLPLPPAIYYDSLEQCWLKQLIDKLPWTPTHSEGDNPAKNTLAYHIVNHQKFEWLYQAAQHDKLAQVFVWVDYGIFHVPGVTAAVIQDFFERVVTNDLAIPGCWPAASFDPRWPDWRFCGGVMVIPRQKLTAFFGVVKIAAAAQIMRTRNVTWEVNTLALVEKAGTPKIRWYEADHNETIFSNYSKDAPHAPREPERIGKVNAVLPSGAV